MKLPPKMVFLVSKKLYKEWESSVPLRARFIMINFPFKHLNWTGMVTSRNKNSLGFFTSIPVTPYSKAKLDFAKRHKYKIFDSRKFRKEILR